MSISSGKSPFAANTSFSSSSVFNYGLASVNSLVSLNLLNSSSFSFRALIFRASASANSIAVLFTTEEAADDPFDLRLLES